MAADDDADKTLSRDQAAKLIGISTRTLDRLPSNMLPRRRLSAGRVGYLLADVREYLRAPEEVLEAVGADWTGHRNYIEIKADGGEIGSEAFEGLLPGITKVLVRRPRGGQPIAGKTITLPNALGWRDLVVIDRDGVAGIAPITLLASEGEFINGGERLEIKTALGSVRLVALVSGDDEPDGWWVV